MATNIFILYSFSNRIGLLCIGDRSDQRNLRIRIACKHVAERYSMCNTDHYLRSRYTFGLLMDRNQSFEWLLNLPMSIESWCSSFSKFAKCISSQIKRYADLKIKAVLLPYIISCGQIIGGLLKEID